jgi:hypothetical protein
MTFYLRMVFLATVLLYTALAKLSFGVPVRTLLSSYLFVLLLFAYRREFLDTVKSHQLTVLVFAGLTVTGGLVTILNGRGLDVVIGHALSDLIQPFLILVCTLVLLRLAGVGFVARVFVGSALLTGAVALLQFADIGPAWRLRDWLGVIQAEPADLLTADEKIRPMGVSLTPIVYSYHIASAYILLNLLHRLGRVSGSAYAVLVLSMLAMAVANGTRSLVLGILAQEALFSIMRMRLQSLLWIGVLAIAGMAGLALLEAIGSRVATLSDTSAASRVVLYIYGLRLAADHPFGLGWGFQPGDLAWLYWEHLSGFINSDGVFRLGIHNAFLNFFLTFGLFGVAVIAFAIYVKPRKFGILAMCSTAYIVNTLLHNDGLFVGDSYYWFAFAVFVHLYQPGWSAIRTRAAPRALSHPIHP